MSTSNCYNANGLNDPNLMYKKKKVAKKKHRRTAGKKVASVRYR
ncbi:MAG: hypothetical protein WCT37_03805 [Patescibacteria group bacterium]